VKYEGPRFKQDLPNPVKQNIIRIQNKTLSPIVQDSQAELFIEDLIRNRQEIVLPKHDKPRSPSGNFRDKFIKTRSQMMEERKAKCGSLLQDIRDKARADWENFQWLSKPLRRWDSRSDRVIVQNRFQNLNRSNFVVDDFEEPLEDLRKKNRGMIGNILEACGEDILNWPS
jgi:hypothetical protein